ncbi:MAG: hypothetical protein AAF585_26035 [Verrucomicrobiota bacterium]
MNSSPKFIPTFDQRAFSKKYPKPHLQRDVIELFGEELPPLIRDFRYSLENKNQKVALIVSKLIEDIAGVFEARSLLEIARQITIAIQESDFESAGAQFSPLVRAVVQLRGDLRRFVQQLPNPDMLFTEAA